LGAKLNGDAIDNPGDRSRLARANQTVHETRAHLRHGRGNVFQDIEATGGECIFRTSMSYEIGDRYGVDARSGAALAYGAGNCDQHGDINSRLHAPKLHPGETTHTVEIDQENMALSGGPTGHTFSELHAPPREVWKKQGSAIPQKVLANPPPIVMDSWANGPAVRRQDSTFAPHAGAITPRECFDRQTGRHAMENMLDAMRQFLPGGGTRGEAEEILRRKRTENLQLVNWNNVQIVNHRFAQRAAQKRSNISRLACDIMAAGAGREAYNLSVSEATKSTTLDSIRYETENLNHQDRPKAWRPVASQPTLNLTPVPGSAPEQN
jgi:hypothetical protein